MEEIEQVRQPFLAGTPTMTYPRVNRTVHGDADRATSAPPLSVGYPKM